MSKLIPSSSLGSKAFGSERSARVGVLGLQGDFSEHLTTLRGIGAEGIDVRRPEQLDEIDALIIPGGESTTIGKLAQNYGITPKLRERAAQGMPVWGTCAGAIFLAKVVPGHPHPLPRNGLSRHAGARRDPVRHAPHLGLARVFPAHARRDRRVGASRAPGGWRDRWLAWGHERALRSEWTPAGLPRGVPRPAAKH